MYIPSGYAFLYRSVFTVMKKNETQKARTKAAEVRSQKEQMEDRAFNRMLLWLAGTVLTEVVLLLVNRYYIHARVEELDHLATLHTILGIAPIAGVILFAGLLYWGLRQRKKGDANRDGIIQIILACAFLLMGLGAFGMRLYGAAAAPLILGIVVGLAALVIRGFIPLGADGLPVFTLKTSLPWLYAAAIIQILSYALFTPSCMYYVNELIGEANRNKGQTFLSMGMCVSAVAGTLVGGAMLNAAGGNPRDMLLLGAAIAAVGVIILFLSPKTAAPTRIKVDSASES